MTAQCAANGMWITMDAVRAVPGDPVEAAFSTVYGYVLAVCARAGVRPVLPVDRELLATRVLERLGRRMTRWLMPCPNYPHVAAALRVYAARRRRRVSATRISDGRGREAPYTMIIRKRKRRVSDGPEGKHIAFASNSPSPGPDTLYPRRWRIEISYKMLKQTRMRTSSRDEHVRIFCFVVSLMVHNAWIMLHSDRIAGGDDRRIPKTTLKMLTLLEFCQEYGVRPWLRLPRKLPPLDIAHIPTFGMCGLGLLRQDDRADRRPPARRARDTCAPGRRRRAHRGVQGDGRVQRRGRPGVRRGAACSRGRGPTRPWAPSPSLPRRPAAAHDGPGRLPAAQWRPRRGIRPPPRRGIRPPPRRGIRTGRPSCLNTDIPNPRA